MKLYLIRPSKGIDAVAEYDDSTGEFTVLKGSKVCPIISNAPTFRGRKSIIKQRQLYVEDNVVKQDVVFRSSSTAGNFVTGSSTDGPRSWKNKAGYTFKKVLNELKEN